MATDRGLENVADAALKGSVGPSPGTGVLNQSTEGDSGGPDAKTSLAIQVRQWFAEAWQSDTWTKYRREAEEDMGFYIGGEYQWSMNGSTQDLQKIKASQRAYVSINHVQSVVKVLTGFERQNRYDLKAAPMGEEDAEQATLFSLLMKHEQDKLDAAAVLSEVFEDGIIMGANCLFTGIDWSFDPLFGDITLERLTPGVDVLWDHMAKKPDRSDARFFFRWRYAPLEDLVATYPEHAAVLRREVDVLADYRQSSTPAGPNEILSQFNRKDGYGGVAHHPVEAQSLETLFYSGVEKKLMVVECWYRDYEEVVVLADKESGKVWEVEPKEGGRSAWEIAQEQAKTDPDNMTAIRRKRRIIRMALCVPATYRVLEEADTPYDNDAQAYPFSVYIAEQKRDDIYGIVRNLKDPQRVENRRESQALDVLARYGAMRRMAIMNTIENPTELDKMWSNATIWLKPGAQPPTWDIPPMGELLKALFTTSDRGKLSVREVSGINTDLLGIKGDDTSGVAIARRQAQGQTIATAYFDNYRQMKRHFGRRLAKRIQQIYSYEKTVRITSPNGEGEVVLKLNPIEDKKRDAEGRIQEADSQGLMDDPTDQVAGDKPKVLRDVSSLDYDVIIAETPATPSMRSMALLALLEIIGKVPMIAPALMDVVVDLSDIPDRDRVKQRVVGMMQAQGLLPGGGPGGPPAPGGGGPMPPPGGPKPPAGGPPPGQPPGGSLPMAGPGGGPPSGMQGPPPMPPPGG